MQYSSELLGNEPISLIAFDDVVLEKLHQTRAAIQSEVEPAVVISARCDLLKTELRELYATLLPPGSTASQRGE